MSPRERVNHTYFIIGSDGNDYACCNGSHNNKPNDAEQDVFLECHLPINVGKIPSVPSNMKRIMAYRWRDKIHPMMFFFSFLKTKKIATKMHFWIILSLSFKMKSRYLAQGIDQMQMWEVINWTYMSRYSMENLQREVLKIDWAIIERSTGI